MVAINESIVMTSPVLGPIARLIGAASVAVGGIFGIYIILLILRWIEYKRFGKVLRDMRHELRILNKKIKNIQPKKKR